MDTYFIFFIANIHSTARDMAIITKYAMQNQTFMEYINTPSKTFDSNIRSYTVNNKNKLLNTYDGANGVKTGFTNKAGQCFVGSAKRGDMQLISVVLASGWGSTGKERKWTDTYELLDYGFENYKYVNIVSEGDIAGEINVTNTRQPVLEVVYDQSVMLPLNENERNTLTINNKLDETYDAPIVKGAIVGTAEIIADGKVIHTIGIETTTGAFRHDFNTKIKSIINSFSLSERQLK